jgi:hypothetical protein
MWLVELQKKHPSPWMLDHLFKTLSDVDVHEFKIQIQEFLKFMILFSTKKGGFIPVSKEIDHIWHEYILQTKEYLQLCMDCPGHTFIHHQTISLEEYMKTRDRLSTLNKMLEWIPLYYSFFGEFNDKTARYWTIVPFLSEALGLTLSQINQMAKEKLNL